MLLIRINNLPLTHFLYLFSITIDNNFVILYSKPKVGAKPYPKVLILADSSMGNIPPLKTKSA